MPSQYRVTFPLALVFIFFLPNFFIPGGLLYLEGAKSAFIVFGATILFISFLIESYREGSVLLPKHKVVVATVLLPFVYLVSSFLSDYRSLSLLGYSLEPGTFSSIFIGALLTILVSSIFTNTGQIFRALVAIFTSLIILVVFVVVKILFYTSIESPLGNWTDVAAVSGFLALLSAITLGIIPLRSWSRSIVFGGFFISILLMVFLNFSTALILAIAFGILIIFYFLKLEKPTKTVLTLPKGFKTITLPIALVLLALVVFIRPPVFITRNLKIENTEVRPSWASTIEVSKKVLSHNKYFGSGPNTFRDSWLLYKPVNINKTPFWMFSFPFGISFFSTQVSSVGIIGSATWILFLVLLVFVGVRGLQKLPSSRVSRFVLVSVIFGTLFFWTTLFLYVSSASVIILAFIFSGLLIGILEELRIIKSFPLNLKEPLGKVFSGLLVIGILSVAFMGFRKTLAHFHWKQAVDLSLASSTDLDFIEDELNKAIKFSTADIYYLALSRIYFTKAQAAATGGNLGDFQEFVKKSLESAHKAVSTNSSSYQNWFFLGLIYGELVPKPLAVEGAYDSAKLAFEEARKRNPYSPEPLMSLAKLEFYRDERSQAKLLIEQALNLKEDYAEAQLFLREIEKN